MKTILKILLILIIISVVLILSIFTYILIKNPLGLGEFIKTSITQQDTQEETIQRPETQNFDHPLLSESQEATAIKMGIDIEKIPTEITPEQQSCGIEKLGEDRIKEILEGSQPTPLEIVKVLPCADLK